MDFGLGDFDAAFMNEFNRIGVVNLALFGKTGVGKSTLVNTFFGTQVAATGIGEPVTSHLTYYRLKGRPFGFFDSPGFEVGQSSEDLLKQLDSYVYGQRAQGLDQQIHAVWYCVRAADRRFEPAQADFVRSLLGMNLPVILVMTQVNKKGDVFDPEAEELRDQIRQQFTDGPQPHAIVMVNAKANVFTEIAEHGLENLLERTSEVVPEAVRQALIAAQQVNLESKRNAAWAAVKQTAMAAASAAAAIPVPGAALAALLPIEASMLARVSAVYGVPLQSGNVARLAFAAVGALGFRAGGELAVAQVLKFIPGIGTVAGGALNAAAASALTVAMGRGWMTLCETMVSTGVALSEDEVAEAFKKAVKERNLPDLD